MDGWAGADEPTRSRKNMRPFSTAAELVKKWDAYYLIFQHVTTSILNAAIRSFDS